MIKKISLLNLLAFLAIASPAAPPTGHRTGFYVSADGNDSHSGTLREPFRTLERARDAVRTIRQSRPGHWNGFTVWIRGGDYLLSRSLDLDAQDSGTQKAPVIWQAYGNERVRLLGGRPVTSFSPVKDAAVLARLDEKARNHVLMANLVDQGITDFGTLKSRGFARPITPSHGELFFDGRPMTLARWPNEGKWMKITGFPAEGASDDGHGTLMGALENGFYYDSDRPGRWKDTSQIWVHGYWAYDWANSYEHVALLDRQRHLIKTDPPYGNYGFNKGQRFYFLNILEELDEPGEWYIDQDKGILYFWPPQPIETGEVIFSMLETPMIGLNKVDNLIFRGIDFGATRGTAIVMTGCNGVRIENCDIRDTGNRAVTIDEGQDNGVVGCDITDTGDGGVSMTGGDRQTLTPGGHFVENCHFQRQARWSKCYAPAILMTGVGLRASHNLIHDHPHCAILFTGNDMLIEYNEIHHIALETGDVGAIYTGRDYSFRGNRIICNYIHETGGVGMGSMGVYMDDCVSGTEVTGNLFWKVHWAMFIGGGRDHRVTNNLFIDCDPAVRADGRGLDPSPVWHNMVNVFMRNQLAKVPATLYRERYPAIRSLDRYYGSPGGPAITGDAFKGIPPEGNVIRNNMCVGKWTEIAWLADPKLFDIRDNYVTTDTTRIGSPEKGFRLPLFSPARKMGFRPVPVGRIGIKKGIRHKA